MITHAFYGLRLWGDDSLQLLLGTLNNKDDCPCLLLTEIVGTDKVNEQLTTTGRHLYFSYERMESSTHLN